ncbi:MAG: histidine kinase [Verrucomicrobia bacterium GWC2_42_7]|nr:MAG: histidine kinase [Verrucomicrobia bacterium GWC2_42_7]
MNEQLPPLLIVDDDDIILVALRETVGSEGYRIVTCNSPIAALEHAKKEEFAVIISDQRMAEMTGLEFLSEAKKIQPLASRILITGVLTLNTVIDAINNGEIFRFLAKPWIREELLATVKNAAQRYQLLKVNEQLQAGTLKLNEQITSANLQLQQSLSETIEQKVSIDKAHEALHRNFEQSLQLCFNILSTFHPLLGQQTKETIDICKMMCESGHIAPRDQHVLKVSSWLYNIGLVGIGRDIIHRMQQSPDELSEEERTLLHSHPIYGQSMVSFVENLADVGRIIRAHHEHWDGSGYPDGLAGELIPVPALYLSVVTHYVESHLPKEEALEYILENSGNLFEPEAVRLFLKVTKLIQLPKKIKEVLFSELEPGMVIAKELYSSTGLLLMPEGEKIDMSSLNKIKAYNFSERIHQRILVYEA